ncbi:hypothetical protein CQW23_08111 [Capsicum baccatum]|uniref:Uncharacterized protein ycf23 n=1 Tax=Capsicum baccatum TaxID=33114 RepID=A0A2G2X882_CAPBA|nr:hypothetical protein CQW23_08111 [Capsicum baccatum]
MKAISSTVIVNIYQIKSSFICLQVCVSSVDPALFSAVVETGALMILNLTRETKRLLPSVILSVTVPHTLSLPDQVKLAEQLELEGVDIIQTEEGKCSTPSKAGVLRLIEKNGANKFDGCVMNGTKKLVIERVRDISVQKGVVLDSPPTNDDDDDVDS